MSGDNVSGPEAGGRLIRIAVGLLIALVGIGYVAVRGCQEGPFGRKQIVTLSAEQENALGAQAFTEVLKESRVIGSGPIVDQVRGVTGRLEKATKHPEFLKLARIKERPYNWEVRVVESKEMNAFCLPGGKMVVYTGILPICQTEAGLATVMGHEISHALSRHGAERLARDQMMQAALSGAAVSLSDLDVEKRQRVMALLGAGAKFGALKYSRQNETEADHMGLFLMAAAGFDPRESVKFWERMKAQASGGRTPQFLSTHPSHETRIRDLANWMPEARELFRASPDRDLPDHKLKWPPAPQSRE